MKHAVLQCRALLESYIYRIQESSSTSVSVCDISCVPSNSEYYIMPEAVSQIIIHFILPLMSWFFSWLLSTQKFCTRPILMINSRLVSVIIVIFIVT
jgi:hypothetical protein